MNEELYLIQDTRTYVGNSMLFWCVDGRGYTTDPEKAWKVPLAKAQSFRATDRPIPLSVVERVKKYHVDMQDIKDEEIQNPL